MVVDVTRPDSGPKNYFVGIVENTGVGKSCLTNALLGLGLSDEIALTSQAQTCTAAAIFFKYPTAVLSAFNYSAKVYIKPPHGDPGILSRIIEFRCGSIEALRGAIKPYVVTIGSSSRQDLWPQVQMVEVFVKADLLKNGIVLVDLPADDALDTRSQVVSEYRGKLDCVLVAAPAQTAVYQFAGDSVRGRGLLKKLCYRKDNSQKFGLVITKMDDIKWEQYAEHELPTELRFDGLALWTAKQALARDIRTQLDQRGGNDLRDLTDVCKAYEKLDGLSLTLQKLEARNFRVCVDARNQHITQGIKDNLNCIFPLEDLPIFSTAERALHDNHPQCGFRDSKSTGVSTLRDWIMASSLSRQPDLQPAPASDICVDGHQFDTNYDTPLKIEEESGRI